MDGFDIGLRLHRLLRRRRHRQQQQDRRSENAHGQPSPLALIAAASNPGLGVPDNFMAEAAPPG
jgi:hypothetical protein